MMSLMKNGFDYLILTFGFEFDGVDLSRWVGR
jgi:hypothetical protein